MIINVGNAQRLHRSFPDSSQDVSKEYIDPHGNAGPSLTAWKPADKPHTSLVSMTYSEYTFYLKMYICNFKTIIKILDGDKHKVCSWTLPLEDSMEAVSVGSGEISGHG